MTKFMFNQQNSELNQFELVCYLSRFENRITTLEEQQKQDYHNFGDRKSAEKELKASLQQTREQSQQEIKDLKLELEPMRSLSQAIANTPGGLKTWMAAGTIALFVSLTAIDIGVRAIGVDRLFRHWLIEQTKIEEIVSD